MGLKTRLDSRSDLNKVLHIVDSETGKIVAWIESTEPHSINLDVSTLTTHHVTKPNGWSSKK